MKERKKKSAVFLAWAPKGATLASSVLKRAQISLLHLDKCFQPQIPASASALAHQTHYLQPFPHIPDMVRSFPYLLLFCYPKGF